MNFIVQAFKKRDSLIDEENNCCRLFNGESDGMDGLSVDLYGDYLLIQFFNESLFNDKNNIINSLVKQAEKDFNLRGVLFKNRLKNCNIRNINELRVSEVVEGELPPEGYTVKHSGIRVKVDLESGQSTGVFMDMRNVRSKLKVFYQDNDINDMLNLFSYTGVFSIHGLKNGVKKAINVDLSKPVLKRAKENYIINDIPVDERDFNCGTSLQWLKFFHKKEKHFSLIVFDPPTFSRNKKETFSIERDYSKYLNLISTVSNGNYVLSAINTFKISEKQYFDYHPSQWENVFYENESEDFKVLGDPYLKVGLWKVK